MKSRFYYQSIFIVMTTIWMFCFGLFMPIIPLDVCAFAILVLCFLGCIFEKRVYFDFSFMSLALVFTLMAYIDIHAYVDSTVYYVIIVPLGYILGKIVVGGNSNNWEKRVYCPLLGLTFGSLIQGLLNYYNEYNEEVFSTETWTEFWTKTPDISRSLFEIYFVLFTCMIVWAVLEFRRNTLKSVLIIIGIICTQVLIAKSEGRMNAGILFGVLMITLLIKVAKRWIISDEKIRNIIKRLAIVVIVVCVVFLVLFENNLLGIKDAYLNSYLNSSGGIIHNVRFAMMLDGLKQMRTNPLGGWQIQVGGMLGQVNSTWFLFAQEYDNVVFALLMIFVLLTTISGIKLAIKVRTSLDYVLVAMFSGMNVYFLLETCPWRHRNYFIFLVFICGIIKRRTELDFDITANDSDGLNVYQINAFMEGIQ